LDDDGGNSCEDAGTCSANVNCSILNVCTFTKRLIEAEYLFRASSTTSLLGAPSTAAGMAVIISLITAMSRAWVNFVRLSSIDS
jgi:hypothetical protein